VFFANIGRVVVELTSGLNALK